MHRKIFFRPERCMFCLSCVLACQTNSLRISDVRKILSGQRPLGRMTITFSRGTPWAWKCQHCTSAPCVEACVTGSLVQSEEGMGVVHNSETCVGCGSCLLACPYGALSYDNQEERTVKCNLCLDEKVPPCIRACQSRALVCTEPDHLAWEKKKKFAQELRLLRNGN